MNLLEVEGARAPVRCPIAGDATAAAELLRFDHFQFGCRPPSDSCTSPDVDFNRSAAYADPQCTDISTGRVFRGSQPGIISQK